MNGTDAGNSYKTLIQGRTSGDDQTPGPGFRESQALLVKSVDTKNRRITALASTGTLDRHDEAIKPEAFKELLPVYMQNPVVITSHQHRLQDGHSSVVGNVVKAWIDERGLWVIIEFVEGTALGDEYWILYRDKKQRALSVGIIPWEWEYEEREGKRVCVYTKVELLEISCVPVGANRDALSRSKQRKIAWLDDKKEQERADEFAAVLLGIKKTGDPFVDEPAKEGFGDVDNEIEESRDLDCSGIIKGTACGEFAAIIKRQ